MTVYTVSQAYLDGMDAAFRLPVLLEGEILNIDAETQAAVSLSASGMLGGLYPRRRFRGFGGPLPGHRHAGAGSHDRIRRVQPTGQKRLYQRRAFRSGSGRRGEYPISGAAVTLEFGEDWHYYTGKGELTLLVPGAARIQIDVVYDHNYPPKTFSQTYAAEGDALVIDDLPTSEWYSNVTVTVLAPAPSAMAARVRRAYFGRVETLDGGEILSLQYTDTSDGAMLQLPQRSAVLSVCNADGRLDQLAEIRQPHLSEMVYPGGSPDRGNPWKRRGGMGASREVFHGVLHRAEKPRGFCIPERHRPAQRLYLLLGADGDAGQPDTEPAVPGHGY